MKKWFIAMVMVLLCTVTFVSADAYLNVDVDTTEDLYAGFDLNAEGDITVWIDGYNLDQRVDSKISNIGSGLSMDSVYGRLARVFTHKINRHDYNKNLFKKVVDAYFIPRQEIYDIYNPKLDQLRVDSLMIYELFSEEEICAARLSVGEKYDFSEVKCNGDTWHKLPSGFVTITGELTIQVNDTNTTAAGPKWNIPTAWNPETRETTIEWRQRLCDRGFKKHCKQLEE